MLPALGPFEQGSGIQTVDLAGYATGGGSEWSITGPAGIEIEDGLTTIPTTLTQAAAAATVTIQNSGGSAQRSTTITITDKRPTSSGVSFSPLSFVQGRPARRYSRLPVSGSLDRTSSTRCRELRLE